MILREKIYRFSVATISSGSPDGQNITCTTSMVAVGSNALSELQAGKPAARRGRAGLLAHPVQVAQRHVSKRRSSAVRAATLEESASSSSQWFTQSNSLFCVGEPNQRAQQLENSFWHHPVLEVPATREEAMVLMERLQQETAALGTGTGLNVVAFTGGNGPALTAYLLNCVFDGAVVACVGPQPQVPRSHVEHAKYVAELLGIEVMEVDGALWSQLEPPQVINTEANEICESLTDSPCEESGMAIFSGVTADDLANSRKCRRMHGIKAPLAGVSRATVNALSTAVGLPTWTPRPIQFSLAEELQAVAV